ncbi:MAG TPA: GNAT family N-acetyltransferase [Pyrinomonadaceae bacterium]|nr:GNAT family N-acetyltransferase [Pyrinomonadaceae bacterium]
MNGGLQYEPSLYIRLLELMISIRLADQSDVEALCALDLIAVRENERWEFIKRSVASSTCYVVVAENEVSGYGVLNYTFYGHGWIDMLYVHSNHRRRGAGEALLRHLESVCETPKLFVSTNLSNLAMQSLLVKLEYVLSGVIHNLDEGDPEIVYFKRLR